MTKDQLINSVLRALDSVRNERPQLRIADIGERTVATALAGHMVEPVRAINPELSVDSEYNIDPNGFDKFLDTNEALRRAAESAGRKIYEGNRVKVVPDIVIHRRGTHEANIAVVEIKIGTTSNSESNYAVQKLIAFQNPPFSYKFGVLLTLPREWGTFADRKNIKFPSAH